MTLFYISDTHFSHANFLTFTDAEGKKIRPFTSVEEMDEHMVARWNSDVRPQDHVWHLGDVTMFRNREVSRVDHIMRRLNGHKRLILGNHDHGPLEWYAKWFEKVRGSHRHEQLLLTHIPVHPDGIPAKHYNVHGHIHERLVMESQHHMDRRYVNVSVERLDYTPIALEQLKALL